MKKFKNFRTKALAVFLVCSALLTSCGSSESSSFDTAHKFNATQSIKSDMASEAGYNGGSYDDYAAETYAESDSSSANTVFADEADSKNNLTAEAIAREMLVYSCSMNVDVLDFEKATDEFKVKMNQYGGFIESENLSDGGSAGRWYNENEQKWHKYTATVRIPSRVYDDFCTAVGELGDLRSKNASVENVSQEYSDLSLTLEIYQKKEDRYLEMLSKAKDDSSAIVIEEKLAEVQVDIAKIKTRMNQIKTDVAYSYVYVTISEVKEYQEEPVRTDTFVQRLSNTLKDAGSGFLGFLEELLFFVIYAAPYLILLALAVFLLVKITGAVKKRSAASKEKKALKKIQAVEEKKNSVNTAGSSDSTETADKDSGNK